MALKREMTCFLPLFKNKSNSRTAEELSENAPLWVEHLYDPHSKRRVSWVGLTLYLEEYGYLFLSMLTLFWGPLGASLSRNVQRPVPLLTLK